MFRYIREFYAIYVLVLVSMHRERFLGYSSIYSIMLVLVFMYRERFLLNGGLKNSKFKSIRVVSFSICKHQEYRKQSNVFQMSEVLEECQTH